MLFDSKDKQILAVLEENSRSTLSEISKKVRVSRETVNYRINRLIEKKVIGCFLTEIDFERLGFINFVVYIKIKNITEIEEKRFLSELNSSPQISWIANVGGKYDLMVGWLLSSIREFDSIYSNLLSTYAKYILSTDIVIRLNQVKFGRSYFFKKDSKEVSKNRPIPKCIIPKYNLDKEDKQILFLLSNSSRSSCFDIGKTLKIPSTTVSYKMRKLFSEGIIRKYTLLMDPSFLGHQTFKMLIYLNTPSSEIETKLRGYAEIHPKIMYFVKCLGAWNFEMDINVASLEEYQTYLKEFRNKFKEDIKDIEFLILFQRHKFTTFTKSMLD